METTTAYAPQYGHQRNRRWSARDEERRIRRIDGEAHGAIKTAIALSEKGDQSGWNFVVKGILERIAMNDLRPGVKNRFLEACPRVLIPRELKEDWRRMQDKILHTALDQARENNDLWEEIVKAMTELNTDGELRRGVRARLVELCPPDILPPALKFEGEVGWSELEAALKKPASSGLAAAKAEQRAKQMARAAAQPKKGSNGGGSDNKKGQGKKK